MIHGSRIDPPNRFDTWHREADPDHFEWDPEHFAQLDQRPIEYLADTSRSIVSRNDSPDVPFASVV